MNSGRKHDTVGKASQARGNRTVLWLLLALPVAGALGSVAYFNRSTAPPPKVGIEIVATMPHDPLAYTQGLVWENGKFYESTGHYGRSELRRVDPASGGVEQSAPLGSDFFAEGIALVGDEIFQLTWREGQAIVYDKHTLQEKRRHNFAGEGWGLAYDGKQLILSNGTSQLQFLDPATFQARRTINVTSGGSSVEDINELEMVEGELYANIWYSNQIAVIDPASGQVKRWIDLSALEPRRGQEDAVLNGIAYDAANKRLFVTGKLWPRLYEIRVLQP